MHKIEHHLCIICGHTCEEIEDGLVLQCHPPKGKARIATRNKARLIARRNNEFAAIQDPASALKKHKPKAYLNYLKELR